jgi:hypothetical protein
MSGFDSQTYAKGQHRIDRTHAAGNISLAQEEHNLRRKFRNGKSKIRKN